MKAIILAAGRGSRMKELTASCPKCLTNLNGKPILEWQLQAFRKANIKEIAIVSGYKRRFLTKYNLVEFHNKDWAKTNMITSLACAETWLKENVCIVSYGDIFFDHSALESLKKATADIAITYDSNWKNLWIKRFKQPLLDAETFKINGEDVVVDIGNKPKGFKEIQGQFMGLFRLTPKGWSVLQKVRQNLSPTKCNQIDTTYALRKVIESNMTKVKGVKYEKPWGEVDTETDLSVYKDYKNFQNPLINLSQKHGFH